MSLLSLLNQRFNTALAQLGVTETPALVQPTNRPEFGDYQVNGVMAAAKKLKKKPRDLAQQLIEQVSMADLATHLDIAGPGFINIHIHNDYLAKYIARALQDEHLAVVPQARQRIMVEFSSVNLAKEMHVGHLRTTIIGDALARILSFLGHDVIRQNHVGDWGTQFGMLMANLVRMQKEDASHFDLIDLETFYRQAKERFDTDTAFADEARRYVVKLQAGDPDARHLWQQFVDISLAHCNAVYQTLDVALSNDDARGESFYNDDLPHIVQELDQCGLLSNQDGTRVVVQAEFKNREGEPLGYIVQKKDGGYLYSTTDLGAIRYRSKTLHLDRCLYVVDVRQNLHFQQLFTLARKAKFAPEHLQLEHLALGTIMGDDGKPFKTRSGDVVKLSALLEEAQERALALVNQKNPSLDEATRRHIAWVIGIGAVKYADLSKSRTTDYIFNWDTMLSFDGNTAPYLQYAYARIQSVFRKASSTTANMTAIHIEHPTEHALALELARLSDVLYQVARDGYPHMLCAYLYSVATAFSRFYEACPVLTAGHAHDSRLQLCDLTARTLKTGLELLGIQVLERM